jgi:hypothetical protein
VLASATGIPPRTRALANVTAHEVLEMLTDPDVGTGWLDSSGEEIADKCNWRFGGCEALGGTRWQLQKLWSNAAIRASRRRRPGLRGWPW